MLEGRSDTSGSAGQPGYSPGNPSGDSNPANDPASSLTRDTARFTTSLSDEDFLIRVRKWRKDSATASKDNREDQADDFKMYAGHQWKKDDKEALTLQKRPCLTLNFTLPIVNSVTGEERINRQEIKVYGRENADDPGAFTMSELVRWVMDTCNGDYAISKAFRSSVISGEGWVRVDFDTIDDPMGKIHVRPVKNAEIYLDPLCEQEDISDARYLILERWVSEDEIHANWPEKVEEIVLFREASIDPSTGHLTETTHAGDPYKHDSGRKLYDPRDKTWCLQEVWHWEVQPGAMLINPITGLIDEVSEEEITTIEEAYQQDIANHEQAVQQYEQAAAFAMQQAQATGQPPQAILSQLPPPPEPPQAPEFVRRPIKTFFQSFVCGHVVLERTPSPVKRLKRFPFSRVAGYWDDEKSCYFGVVRPIKDAQRQHNVEQSAILHMTQTQPKSGWIAPRGAFHDKRKWEQEAGKPGFVGEYNPSRGKPDQIQNATIPRHIIEMAGSRLQTMKDISGANNEIMGMGTKDTAGVVMEIRRKAGMTVLSTLFDNLRLARRVLGEILIAYIQHYISDGRKVRVMGQEGAKYVEASTDLAFGTYDAVVEDAQDTPTDKMATMHIMQTVLPMIVKSGMPIPPSFVDLLPINQHVKDEWKMMLQNMMGMGGQPAPTGQPPTAGRPAPPGQPPGPPGPPPPAPPGP